MADVKTRLQQLVNDQQGLSASGDLMDAINLVREMLHEMSPLKAQPVDCVRWVPVESVEANDYNPNSQAKTEMGLLRHSFMQDGYTQPIVTIWDEERGKFVIIDGFHRYFTCKSSPEILERNRGLLPVVVLDKGINDRMASTVRHNRAKGRHSTQGMASMVFSMLENGMTEAQICKELGMEAEEVIRLKHVTGFSALFKNAEYKRSWMARRQIQAKLIKKG